MPQRVALEYDRELVSVALPDSAYIVPAGAAAHEPDGLADPTAATLAALRTPYGSPPLRELVGAGSRVTIAIPDRVKGGAHDTAHRQVTLRLLLAELDAAGVRRGDVTVVCAVGLHRKNSPAEFAGYLGAELVEELGASLINHDAEDPDGVVSLPDSELGDVVQVNRHVIEADLSIMISHTSGNPYGGFSGGAKMPSTGLTTWRSIRCHHTPRTLGGPGFVPVSTTSRFRDQLSAIAARIDESLPQPMFTVDAVLNARSEQVAVAAGRIPAVEAATWPGAQQRTDLTVPGSRRQVLIIGVPRDFHYGPGMGANPLLIMQAVGASMVRAAGALVDRPVAIAAAVCDGWFNLDEFPAYERIYEVLRGLERPGDLVEYEDEIATDPVFVDAYRRGSGYHPFHGFSMAYLGLLARERAARIYLAGARSADHARGVGAVPIGTVEEALVDARDLVGADPSIVVVPRLSQPAYHLRSADPAPG